MSGKNNQGPASLRYSAEQFDQYFKQLKALSKKSKGGHILSKLATDPITEFLELQLAKIEDDIEEETSSSDEESSSSDDDEDSTDGTAKIVKKLRVKEGTTGEIAATLLKALKKLKTSSQQSFKKDPEDAAYRFRTRVNNSAVFTRAEKIELNDKLLSWTHAESIIYAIAVNTLKDAAQYILDPEGAGRAQVDHLKSTHKKSTKSSTKTFKRIFEKFMYKVGPPLRFQELRSFQ